MNKQEHRHLAKKCLEDRDWGKADYFQQCEAQIFLNWRQNWKGACQNIQEINGNLSNMHISNRDTNNMLVTVLNLFISQLSHCVSTYEVLSVVSQLLSIWPFSEAKIMSEKSTQTVSKAATSRCDYLQFWRTVTTSFVKECRARQHKTYKDIWSEFKHHSLLHWKKERKYNCGHLSLATIWLCQLGPRSLAGECCKVLVWPACSSCRTSASTHWMVERSLFLKYWKWSIARVISISSYYMLSTTAIINNNNNNNNIFCFAFHVNFSFLKISIDVENIYYKTF